jgi:hypothetical protein
MTSQSATPKIRETLMSRPAILFHPGRRPSYRATWATAVREYLYAFASAVGVGPEHLVSSDRIDDFERIEAVTVEHPLLRLEVWACRTRVRRGSAKVGIAYESGPDSTLKRPELQYSGVFADATRPGTIDGLIHRCRWLAGHGQHHLDRREPVLATRGRRKG